METLTIKTWENKESWNILISINSPKSECVIYYNKKNDVFDVLPWPKWWEIKYFNKKIEIK